MFLAQKRQQPEWQFGMNRMIKLRCSLSHAARALHQNLPSGSCPISTAASKPNSERPLTPEQIYAREEKYGAHNYHPLPVALEKGKGEFFSCHQKAAVVFFTVVLESASFCP